MRPIQLPTGTVTFLFTDIAGSTALWERDRDAMQAALAQHDALLRTAIESRGGHVFKTVGDAFCAAFARAQDAVEAAVDAQRSLAAADWAMLGEAAPLRSRMGLHTGEADERGGDYYGPPVNRVARLEAAGHGGQVLLSDATYVSVHPFAPCAVVGRAAPWVTWYRAPRSSRGCRFKHALALLAADDDADTILAGYD